MIHTQGNWNPNDRHQYFVAGSTDDLLRAREWTPNLLIAVNELSSDKDLHEIEKLCAGGAKVFLDSGVFWLTNQHARANSVSMDEALALAPDQIDNFDWLLERYRHVVDRIGDKVWGYIEIDQGGRENKKKTRAMLEGWGYKPIPVYHPMNDGWEYFDELAQNYDRMCFGNIVQAKAYARKRLLATYMERKRKYPHLWIHMLGYTTNHWLNGFPVDSCDSSSWLTPLRWARAFRTRGMGQPISQLDKRWYYNGQLNKHDVQRDDPAHQQAYAMCCSEYIGFGRMWKSCIEERRAITGEQL